MVFSDQSNIEEKDGKFNICSCFLNENNKNPALICRGQSLQLSIHNVQSISALPLFTNFPKNMDKTVYMYQERLGLYTSTHINQSTHVILLFLKIIDEYIIKIYILFKKKIKMYGNTDFCNRMLVTINKELNNQE